jgi:hypothetical protein
MGSLIEFTVDKTLMFVVNSETDYVEQLERERRCVEHSIKSTRKIIYKGQPLKDSKFTLAIWQTHCHAMQLHMTDTQSIISNQWINSTYLGSHTLFSGTIN